MLNSTDRMASEKAEREGAAKSARRAEEASIVSGLRGALQPDEQLLGFARARIAGGIKGRLNIGPEAFFAPFVNVGLTERRFVIQHLHGETGKPSEILPHFFALADLQSIHFADIETYGGTPASRLVLHLANGQSFRLRLTGENNFESAKSIAEVFRSLTSVRKSASGPTQRVCSSCRHIMDRPTKFCPYCGTSQMDVEAAGSSGATTSGEAVDDANLDVEKVTVVVTEPPADLLDDALAFLRNDPLDSPPVPSTDSTHIAEPTPTNPEPTHEDTQVDSDSEVRDPVESATDTVTSVVDSGEETEPIVDSAVTGETWEAPVWSENEPQVEEETLAEQATAEPESSFTPFASTYSEAGTSEAKPLSMEEAPQMPVESAPVQKPLTVHFHIKHPAVQFDEVITGRDADEVVAKLKDRVVSELKFPIKLAAMRLTPLEFAQEIVSKYNQEERQSLPRPNSCREFLHLVQAIGYATVDAG